MSNRPFSYTARIWHRYLGFFLAGIMAVYAISGIVMVFRNTDFLKHDVVTEREVAAGLDAPAAAKALNLRDDRVEKTEGEMI